MNLRAQLSETVARIAADHCPVAVVRRDEAGEPASSLWRELAAAGLDRATAPEAAGGSGLAWRDALALAMAAGEFAMPAPLAESLAAHALAAAAGKALPEGAASFARLVPEGDALRADSVPWGDRIVTLAGVLPDGSLCLLEASAAEREDARNQAGEVRSTMIWRGEAGKAPACPLAGVGAAGGGGCDPLPRGDAGVPDPLACAGASLRAAQLVGAMRRVLAMTVRYAGEREQFGRPIGRFQAVQQQLALMAELVAQAGIAAELAFDRAVLLFDPLGAACAKQVASANALQCASIAHAVHGAIGVTAEYDLQLFTRRMRAWAAEWGGAHHWAMSLGRGLLAGQRSSVWHAVIDASSGSGAGESGPG